MGKEYQTEGILHQADSPFRPPPSALRPPLSPYPPSEFLSASDESRAFAKVRRRILTTLLRQTLSRSRFRVSLVVVLTSQLWAGMFWMFREGFNILQSTFTSDLHAQAVGVVFGTFFAALMLMLVFSSGVILYGSLFRSREIAFLLTIPARTERVFLYKFQDAIVLSSWGFALLGSPMLLAYGVVERSAVVLLRFVAAVGGGLHLHSGGRRGDPLPVGGAPHSRQPFGGVALPGRVVAGRRPRGSLGRAGRSQERHAHARLVPGDSGRLQFSEQRLLPNWWLSCRPVGRGRAATGARACCSWRC